ncbi:MAG: M48 family metallopeptidase [Coriobacteriales bacterium]|jgi:predicted metal-dependent hydrolase
MPSADKGLMRSPSGIEYRLVLRKGMRSIRMRVTEPDGAIVVSAGMRRPRLEIDRFVDEHAGWVRKRRAEVAAKPRRFPANYEDGDTFMLWGEPKVLRVRRAEVGRRSSELQGDVLVVTVRPGDTPAEVEGVFATFLKRELSRALETVRPRCEHATGIECASIEVRNMKTRWGSCTTTTGKIRVSLRLATYSPACLEMIVVHELTHIRYPAHDGAFYAFMDERLPGWREAEKLLRE